MSLKVTSLAASVFSMLSTNQTIVNSQFKTLFGEGLNNDPEQTPWLCVWPGDTDEYPKYMMGGQQGSFRGTAVVDVYHQQYNVDCGAALMLTLKQIGELIRGVVSSDITAGGIANGIVSIQDRLFDYQVKNEALFITSQIRITFDVTG